MADTTISLVVNTGVAPENVTSSDAGTASADSAVDVIVDGLVDKNELYEALTVIRDALHREDLAVPND